MEDVRRCVHFDTWGFQWIGLRCFNKSISGCIYPEELASFLKLVVGPQL